MYLLICLCDKQFLDGPEVAITYYLLEEVN